MRTPLWLSVAMLVAGAGLIAAGAGHSESLKFKQGGTLRVNLPATDIDDIDPSLAYGTTSWHIEYSTALKLVNYPDAPAPRGARLVPEGAKSFNVSADGTTYTFTIRRGMRFSNGVRVTPKNYAYALNRAMNRHLGSPGFQFIADENATNIVGAQDVWDGKTLNASGVQVRGNRLIIRLTHPDGTFLARLAMPFFQAMPLWLSREDKVVDVDRIHALPSAGPYYVSKRTENKLVRLKRNSFYTGTRPRRLQQIDIKVAVNLDRSYEQVRDNKADYTYYLPSSAPEELGRELGLRGRFRVRPANCVSYIAMNSRSQLFVSNPQLRRAVNYAIDRKRMSALSGAYAVLPTDQYLPRGFPGFSDIEAYPVAGDIGKARELAAGHVPSGGPWVYYHGAAAPGPQRAALVRDALSQIGITVELRRLSSIGWWDHRRTDWALATRGWCQDYPDPFDFINVLLHGRDLDAENSNNWANFNDPAYNVRMDRAAGLRGAARLRAYEKLEHDLVTKAAPWAAWGQPTNRFFFSDSVDMRSFAYQPIYEAPPYNLLALK